MTPREFYRENDAAAERFRDQRARELTQVWYGVQLYARWQAGKMPGLSAFLQEAGAAERRGGSDLRASLLTLSKMTGIKLREARPETLAALYQPMGNA